MSGEADIDINLIPYIVGLIQQKTAIWKTLIKKCKENFVGKKTKQYKELKKTANLVAVVICVNIIDCWLLCGAVELWVITWIVMDYQLLQFILT